MNFLKKYLIIFFILFFQGCEDEMSHSFNELVISINNLPPSSDLSRSMIKLEEAAIYIDGALKGSINLSSTNNGYTMTVNKGSHNVRVDLSAPNYLNLATVMFTSTKSVTVGNTRAELEFDVSDFIPYEENFYFYEDFESSISPQILTSSFAANGSAKKIGSRSFFASFSSSTNYTSFKIDDLDLPSTGFYTLVFHYGFIGADCTLDVFIDKYNDSSTSYYSQRLSESSSTSNSPMIRSELEFSTNAIANGKFDVYFGGFSSSGTNCSCYVDNIQVY